MKYHKRVRPLPWYGGKQNGGKAGWIASLLPWRHLSTYVEPCGGMGAVLCWRAPVQFEILNDLNSRVMNWWRMWREYPEDMKRNVVLTPRSREEYERALGMMDHTDSVMRAWAFHVVVEQSILASDESGRKEYRRTMAKIGGGTSIGRWTDERCDIVHDRIRNVQLENMDAVDLMNQIKGYERVVMYVDPPYPSTDRKYQYNSVDMDGFTDSLLAQRGYVAISGYADEWDHLGWNRHEKGVLYGNAVKQAAKLDRKRTEVLWTNYDSSDRSLWDESAVQSSMI